MPKSSYCITEIIMIVQKKKELCENLKSPAVKIDPLAGKEKDNNLLSFPCLLFCAVKKFNLRINLFRK